MSYIKAISLAASRTLSPNTTPDDQPSERGGAVKKIVANNVGLWSRRRRRLELALKLIFMFLGLKVLQIAVTFEMPDQNVAIHYYRFYKPPPKNKLR